MEVRINLIKKKKRKLFNQKSKKIKYTCEHLVESNILFWLIFQVFYPNNTSSISKHLLRIKYNILFYSETPKVEFKGFVVH